ncbi:MAG TPA: DAK2 domain-containing protein, partial [Acidimicrobiales bacterium]|nr:DAK2 domain-containing protein [Acidimicrobiales bacterium]
MTARSSEVLGPEQLVASMLAYRDALAATQATLNRLNVFPVPDGDTGTNMLLTLESVAVAVGELAGPADMAAVASVVGRAALMGARGNSGVILCQILRAFCSDLAPLAKAGACEVAHALRAASDAATAAVLEPAEGTILTVADAAASAAGEVGEGGEPAPGLVAMLEAARRGAIDAVRRTPEQLPVLATAGVVDAGGAGLTLFFDGLLQALDGRPLPGLELPDEVRRLVGGAASTGRTGAGGAAPAPAGADGEPGAAAGARPATGAAAAAAGAAAAAAVTGDAGAPDRQPALPGLDGCRYEVMYLLEAPDAAIPAFKEVWAGIGDSIVVVGGEGLWSCHIHTDEIGAAIEAALDAGRPRRIRVTDLAEQVGAERIEEERWVREAARAGDGEGAQATPDLATAGRARTTRVVAVATGEGIRRIFRSLGAEGVVSGGQS